MLRTGTALPFPLVHVAHCMKSVFVCVMKTGYRKLVCVDLLKVVFRAQFWYALLPFDVDYCFLNFTFHPVGLPPAIPWRIIF